jgi:hypothetical protein
MEVDLYATLKSITLLAIVQAWIVWCIIGGKID